MSPYGRSGVRARHPPAQNGPRRVRHGPTTRTRLIGDRRVRAHACCGQTIAYCREREEQARLSVPKLYARLPEQYVLRSTWRTTQTRGAVPKAACARAVIPMDTVAGGHRVAFPGIARYTQDAAVVLRPPRTRDEGAALLQPARSRRVTGQGEGLPPDGGPEFHGAVAPHARASCDRPRLARPYKTTEPA